MRSGSGTETLTVNDGRIRRSVQIAGEAYDVLSDSFDFCKEEFLNGIGKCRDTECKDNHDIDFSKKGICIYEYQKEGSCRRSESDCWFLHQIPKWYRAYPEGEQEMKKKIEKIKSRKRIISNSNPVSTYNDAQNVTNLSTNSVKSPPVWQNDIASRILPKVSLTGGNMCITPNFSQMGRLQHREQESDNFLDLITKYVEDRLKSQLPD